MLPLPTSTRATVSLASPRKGPEAATPPPPFRVSATTTAADSRHRERSAVPAKMSPYMHALLLFGDRLAPDQVGVLGKRKELPGSAAEPTEDRSRGPLPPGRVEGEPQRVLPPPLLFVKHQRALKNAPGSARGHVNDTKILRYGIRLLCNSGLRVEDIEIYEFVQPNYHVTAASSIMPTVSSPMAHLVVDYRTLRRAQLQREYADLWNCRAKMVCSYQSAPNRYSLNEGGPILAGGSDWGGVPQNRGLGAGMSDAFIPADPEYNVQIRDNIMEVMCLCFFGSVCLCVRAFACIGN